MKYPLKCLYLNTLFIYIIIMKISLIMRSPEVKRSQKLATGENLTFDPKNAYQIRDLFALTFGNVRKDAINCFDMYFMPINVK